MLWKILKYLLLLFVLGTALFAAYGWFNTSVSLDYARQQQKTERERAELLRQFSIIRNRGVKRSEISQVVNQKFAKEHVIKEQKDRILLEGLVFRFDESDSLTEIQFLGNEPE